MPISVPKSLRAYADQLEAILAAVAFMDKFNSMEQYEAETSARLLRMRDEVSAAEVARDAAKAAAVEATAKAKEATDAAVELANKVQERAKVEAEGILAKADEYAAATAKGIKEARDEAKNELQVLSDACVEFRMAADAEEKRLADAREQIAKLLKG